MMRRQSVGDRPFPSMVGTLGRLVRVGNMADVSVRTAGGDDVAEIARIQVLTWQTAYERLLPPEVLQAATPELVTDRWQAAVTQPPSPQHHVLVATEQSVTVVGFVAFGPSTDEDADDTTAEIATMLVEPRWGRRGHGSRLLAATVDHLRDNGFAAASAWLLDRDTASTSFYESAGWKRDGVARTLAAGEQEIREIRLHVAI